MRQKRDFAGNVWYGVGMADYYRRAPVPTVVDVITIFSTAFFAPRHGKTFKQRPQCFGRFYGWSEGNDRKEAEFIAYKLS